MRNQMLHVILYDHGMKETIGYKVSDRLLAEHLYVISKSAGTQEKDWANQEVIFIPAQPALPHNCEVLAQ